jgi:hypothetical protein
MKNTSLENINLVNIHSKTFELNIKDLESVGKRRETLKIFEFFSLFDLNIMKIIIIFQSFKHCRDLVTTNIL